MKTWTIPLICLLLASCQTAHTNKASPTEDSSVQSQRDALLIKANAGDAEAQFQLGESWCCGRRGVYSTQEAIKWWCKAALQKHENAAKALKRQGEYGLCMAGTNKPS